MRRRWLLILGLAVFVGAGGFAIWSLTRPQAFRFLHGRRPIPYRAPALDFRGFQLPEDHGIYSFQADYAQLIEEARAELNAFGYHVASFSDGFTTFFENGKDEDTITILNGVKMTELSTESYREMAKDLVKGWVTVWVPTAETKRQHTVQSAR